MRRTIILALAFLAPLLGATSASASTTCEQSRVVVPTYGYCFFQEETSADGPSWTTTTSLARTWAAADAGAASTRAESTLVEDHERNEPSASTQRDTTRVSVQGRLAHRMSYDIFVNGSQARRDDGEASKQSSTTTAHAYLDDALLRRWGLATGYGQGDLDTPRCRETVLVQVQLIADSIGLTPGGECRAKMPWLDMGRVSTTAAAALP